MQKIRQPKNFLQWSTEPSAAIGIQPCNEATIRTEKDPMIIIATAAQVGIRHSPRYSHCLSSALFVEPGIDLRHQDWPKGKLPDLCFTRQPAQIAAS